MLTLARRLAFISLLFCAPAPTLVAQEAGASAAPEEALDQVREVAAELASIGYELDLTGLSVETLRRSAMRKRGLRHIDLRGDSSRYAGIVAWLQGFGVWDFEDAEELSAAFARAVDAEREAFFVPEENLLAVRERRKLTEARLELRRAGLAHELVHAWRSQVDPEWLEWGSLGTTTEEAHIRQAMIEGEADFVAAALALLRQGTPIEELGVTDLDDVNALFSELELFTLQAESGLRFGLERWKSGGWGSVRDMWAERPGSTEQLLHPAKYGEDLPSQVVLPDWPDDFPAAELVGVDTLGELEVYRLLRIAQVERDVARVAAAGWDGDALALYRTEGGDSVVVWRSLWDRELDAQQFYAALAEEGDGEWRIRGRVIDWVRSFDGALGARWWDHAADHPLDSRTDANDAASTALVEAAWLDEAALDPFVADDRWVVPRAGFSVPIPTGWVEDQLGEIPLLTLEGDERYMLSMVTISIEFPGISRLEEAMEQALEGMAIVDGAVTSSEIVELDGRRFGFVMVEMAIGPGVRSKVLVSLRGPTVTSLTVGGQLDVWEAHADEIEAVFAGVACDADAHERPVLDDEQAEERELPAVDQSLVLTVVDAVNEEPVPLQDVWVAVEDYDLWDAPKSRQAEHILKRGRRYTTDRRGEVRIAYRQPFGSMYMARSDTRLGPESLLVPPLRGDYDPNLVLYVHPIRDLEVVVQGTDGAALEEVPVGFFGLGDDGEWWLRGTESSQQKGRVSWEQFLGTIQWSAEETEQLEVGFAFPQTSVPNVVIDPQDPPEEPISLTLPETGSLLVHVLESEHRAYSFASIGAELRIAGDERAIEYEADRSDRSRAKLDLENDALFAHVGLGLELEVRAQFSDPWQPVTGPTRAGEQVEVTLEVQERDSGYSSWGSDWMYLSGIALGEDGAPAANRKLRWRVSPLQDSRTLGKGSSRTNAKGLVSLAMNRELEQAVRSHYWATATGGVIGESDLRELQLEIWTDDDSGPELFWAADFLSVGGGADMEIDHLSPQPVRRYLEVTVVDVAGEPVMGNLVLSSVDEQGGIYDDRRSLSWDDGASMIEYPQTREGCRYLLSVEADGYKPLGGVAIEPGQSDIEVALEDHELGVRVEGVLLMPPGRYRDGVNHYNLPTTCRRSGSSA